ncbi:MAG: hypothetical protein Aurels2KO_06600 [Aureliella sp.]
MQKFIKRYFAALSTLLVSMAIYCAVIVPWVEPEGRPPHAIPPVTDVATDRSWESFFQPGSWQTENPSLLQSKQGTLLAKNWEQIGPKTLQLQPLTIIIPVYPEDEDVDSEAAIDPNFVARPESLWIVSAEEGARIRFEKNFDAKAKSDAVPSIESGTLTGQIHITRKSLSDELETPWTLTTSDLFIERNRVYTNEQVRIDSGKSVVLGRGLRIDMLGDIFSASTSSSSRWGPLDRLEVYRIEKVQIALENGGLWKGLSDSLDTQQRNLDDLPAHLEVNCNGRFTMDFRRRTAALNNGVKVHHFLGDSLHDEFACQELEATFLPDDAPAAENEELIELGGMRLEELVAIGADQVKDFFGEKKVELKAPSIGAYAAAKRLQINFVDQRIEFDGKLATAGAALSSVWLQYGNYEFLAPSIGYHAGATPEALGYLIADGPGELNLSADHEMGVTQIRWKDELNMLPTDNPMQHMVQIKGSTLVESRKYGFVTSETLSVWLTKNAEVQTSSLTEPESEEYRPTHVHASTGVTITSEAMVAQVDHLELGLIFVDPPLPGSESDNQLTLKNSSGQGMYQWVAPAKDERHSGPGSLAVQSVPLSGGPAPSGPFAGASGKKRSPVHINGKQLKSRLVLRGRESWIDDLQMTGPLTLSSPEQGDAGTPSWRVEGGELGLITSPTGDVNLQVSGQPARIVVGGGVLTGPSINFDQKTNLIWMDHPGNFALPPSEPAAVPLAQAKPDADSPLSAARKIQWIGTPVCTWNGSMQFDGRIVHIKGGVEFKGKMHGTKGHWWYVQSNSKHLDIFMDAPVDMQAPSDEEIAIDRLQLEGNVVVHAIEYDQTGEKLNYAVIDVPTLALHAKTNQIIGDGPGSIHSYNQIAKTGVRDNGKRPAAPISGSHLVFRDHVVGFLDRNEVVFEGKVEVANGPLASLQESIDLYQMRSLEMGQMRLECDQLRVYDTSQLPSQRKLAASRQSTWNLQARGNVGFEGVVESGHYKGTGSEVAYVQAKEHLILSGDARRDAEVVRKRIGDSQPNIYGSIRKAVIDTRTLDVETITLGAGGAGVGSGVPALGSGPTPTGPLVRPAPGPATQGADPRGAVSGFLPRGR